MKVSGKKAKSRSVPKTKKKVKASKSKPVRGVAKKTKTKKAKAKKSASAARSVAALGKGNVGTDIKELDFTSLQDHDIHAILEKCSATLDFRRIATTVDATFAEVSDGFCYTKSGESPIVSVWKSGFKVGQMTEAEADARGIKPCG